VNHFTLDSISDEGAEDAEGTGADDDAPGTEELEETHLEDTVGVESGAEASGATSTDTNPDVVASNQTETSAASSGWPSTSTCLWIGAGLVGASILGYLVYRRCTK